MSCAAKPERNKGRSGARGGSRTHDLGLMKALL